MCTGSISDADSNRPTVFDTNFFDALRDANFSPIRADLFFDHSRDLPASSARKPRSIHVVADDHCVGDKSTALRFDSVVPPVHCQECSQRGIAKTTLHIVRSRLTYERCMHLLRQADQRGHLLRDNLTNIVERHPRVCPRDVVQTHVPARALASKCVGQSPWGGVFFEDEDSLLRRFCEQSCGC